jgi:hypothetical protein
MINEVTSTRVRAAAKSSKDNTGLRLLHNNPQSDNAFYFSITQTFSTIYLSGQKLSPFLVLLLFHYIRVNNIDRSKDLTVSLERESV